MSGYAVSGGAALLLLSLLEWTDLNALPRMPFDSLSARLELLAYASLNVLTGLGVGLLVGVSVKAATLIEKAAASLLAHRGKLRLRQRLLIGSSLATAAAYILNQQRDAHSYIIGVLREAEKIDSIRDFVLNHEQPVSYGALLVLVVCCWALWASTRATRVMSRNQLAVWVSSLIVLIAAGYYIDSRVELQLYEDTLHTSMYLLEVTIAMALTGSLYLASSGIRPRWQAMSGRTRKAAMLGGGVTLASLLVFSISHFGSNQALKVMVFYYTSETKQSYRLAWWVLDRDRDGYPASMGGGDADDSRADINPGQTEIIGDGIDNNCAGGDLTQRDIDDWKRQQSLFSIQPDGIGQPLNIVYIFIDALRADHLGVYGYHRNVSPHIDELAARSCVFDNAFTPAPNTYEALPKFMQSSYWDGHFEPWTQVLASHGYNSLLFPRRIATLRRHVKGMIEAYQGESGNLVHTIDRAIEILGGARSGRPFCVYLYATDTHRPYVRHPEFDFGSSLIDRYDGEIAFLDSQFGRLFDWLQTSGRLSDTAIVIMADHGESLGERGFYKHSSQLYNEQTRIPVIIYVPILTARRIFDYVSSIDLGPTILNIAGLNKSTGSVGASLLPLMKGERQDYPPVYAEQTSKQDSPYVRPEHNVHRESKKYMIITQDGYKLIYNRNYNAFELFDLKSDPQENLSIYDCLPEKATELKRLLSRYIDVVTASRPADADESKYIFGKFLGEADNE